MLALAIAVGMLMLSYWVTNQRLAISGETSLMRNVELVRGWFKPHNTPMADSVLLINVAYDTELVNVADAVGIPAGYARITDRGKLHELLMELKRDGDYRYIVLDVIFNNDIHTPKDSALFTLIASMDRIVIPRDMKRPLADSCLYPKAAPAVYFTNVKFTTFAKYPYIIDGEKSLPLRMYEDITGRTVVNHGLFSTDGYRLARESIVLAFDLRCDSAYTQEGEKTWYNLGADLLGSTFISEGDTIIGDSELYDNPSLLRGNYGDDYQGKYRGKYVIIGAFSDGDMHYSYLEDQAGATILFNAYLSLLHGHHCISAMVLLLLLVAFFFLSYLILGNKTLDAVVTDKMADGGVLSKYAPAKAGRRMLIVFISWMGYSVFLSILCVVTYLLMNEVYDIFVTATVFQIISLITSKIYKYKNKKSHV